VIPEPTQDDAALYALGLLSPEEVSRFEAAMAADPEIAALVAQIETGAGALAASVPPREPPPELAARIMAEIRPAANVVKFPRMSSWLPWAAAACFALIAGTLGYERFHLKLIFADFVIRERLQQEALDIAQTRAATLQKSLDDALTRIASSGGENSKLQAQVDSLRQEVAGLQARDELSQIKIATLASQLKDNPQAMAVVAWDGGAQRGILQTHNMPVANGDQDYQLWIIDPDSKAPVSAGVFDPAQGARFQPIHRVSHAEKFAISLEKKGGSDAPQGPIVLVGG
jgi:anti-sigma-K factor RskA